MSLRHAAALIVFALCAPALAQSEDVDSTSGPDNLFGIESEPLVGPLVADRPDFTESPLTVPMGHIQIEGGFTFYDDPDYWTLPEGLVRLGLTRDLEFRLELPDYFNIDDGPGDDDGITDMSLGVKWQFLQQDGVIPDTGVIPYITLPTGEEPFTDDDVQVGAVLAAGWQLNSELSLTANIGLQTIERDSDDSDTVQTSTSLSLGFPLGEMTGGFVEYYAIYPGLIDEGEHVIDGGVTHHIHNNLMLDARIGFGVSDEAPDFLVGAGVTYRY